MENYSNTKTKNESKIYSCEYENILELQQLSTLVEQFNYSKNRWGHNIALQVKRDGIYKKWTFNEYYEKVYKVSKSLTKLGLSNGCNVNINGYNTPEWFFTYYGSLFSKFIPTGIYTTSSPDQCKYFFNHSDAQVVFVQDIATLDKYIAIKDEILNCKAIIIMDQDGDNQSSSSAATNNYSDLKFKVYKWDGFIELGHDVEDEVIDRSSRSILPNDTATLIYTSGTTSLPKGVMLSHTNLLSASFGCIHSAVRTPTLHYSRLVSYLPLSHIAEQVTTLVGTMSFGGSVSFADKFALQGTLLNTLIDCKPNYFFAVPRVWEKMHAKIQTQFDSLTGVKKKLIEWAKSIGTLSCDNVDKGLPKPWSYHIADTLVFKKVKKTIGLDQCFMTSSGAAPISIETIKFFRSIGIPVSQTYGLSESTGPIISGTPFDKLGTTGKIYSQNVMKLGDDGELLLKGGCVFKGYYKNEEATLETIDQDGWLHTGDIATIDDEGFVTITDRKKEIIITAGGENISPSFIEGYLRQIPGTDQAVVIGDKQKFLISLITVSLASLESLKKLHLYPFEVPATLEDASNDSNLISFISSHIDKINKNNLAQAQTIKRFKILPVEFKDDSDNSEITATKKLKRRVINEKYLNDIKLVYGDLYMGN